MVFDDYKIGILIEANSSISSLTRLNDLMEKLQIKMDGVGTSLDALNDHLLRTSQILPKLNAQIMGFGVNATRSFSMAGKKVSEFNAVSSDEEKRSHSERAIEGALHRSAHEGGIIGGVLAGAALDSPWGIAALAVIASGVKSFQTGSEIQSLQARINSLSIGPKGAAVTSNYLANALPGISAAVYDETYAQTLGITKDASITAGLTPQAAKMLVANQILFKANHRRFTEEDEHNIIKAAEIYTGRGKSLGDYQHSLNTLEKILVMEGGSLPTSNILSSFRYASSVIPGLNTEGLVKLIPLMQSMGSRTGSGLRTFESALLRGQNFKSGSRAESELEYLGILSGNHQIKNKRLLTSDPVDWVNTVLVPAMNRRGIVGVKNEMNTVNTLFSGRAASLAGQIIQNQVKESRTWSQYQKLQGSNGIYNNAMQTNAGKLTQLSAAWENLWVQMSKFINPILITGMVALTKLFEVLNKLISNRFGITKLLHSMNTLTNPQIWKGAYHEVSGRFDNARHQSESWFDKTFHVHLFADGKKIGSAVASSQSNLSQRAQPTSANTPHNSIYAVNGGNIFSAEFQ